MSNEVIRDINLLVAPLKEIVIKIQKDIDYHKLPLKVFETFRLEKRQKELVEKGVSKTMFSRHLKGEAVDFVVFINQWSWTRNVEYYYRMLGELVICKYGDKIEWGGIIWSTRDRGKISGFVDLPHFQLKI